MHTLPARNTNTKQSHYLKKKKKSFLGHLNEIKIFWFHEWHASVAYTSTKFDGIILYLGLCKLKHRGKMSHRQEIPCVFTFVKHFSLRRNIILTKSSLLHVSVVKKRKKKNPAHFPSFISVYLRTLMTLAVVTFNKLDYKGHDPRDTEMELTFSQCQDLTKNVLNSSLQLLVCSVRQGPGMRVWVISTILLI